MSRKTLKRENKYLNKNGYNLGGRYSQFFTWFNRERLFVIPIQIVSVSRDIRRTTLEFKKKKPSGIFYLWSSRVRLDWPRCDWLFLNFFGLL